MDMTKKRLPVGIDSFEKIRSLDFYYVDKTRMIRDLLFKWGEVNLFTRPRRFGKTLNMSMLKAFFEVDCDRSLFDGLEITKETELCNNYMGQFPVISVSLKSVDGMSYQSARAALSRVIGNEARRFSCLSDSERLDSGDQKMYRALTDIKDGMFTMSDEMLCDSLRTLSQLLAKHYGKNVILLIDEYDVPLDKAFHGGYYTEMVSLIRNVFGNALKTNPDLYFAVLTGCLRVAKESIFTGLNNLKVFSGTSARFDEYFGFTDREVRDMLEYYGLEDRYEAVKNWYDGYRFGNTDVYCPWDVISYCDELTDAEKTEPKNYWVNTSGNDAVRYLIGRAGNEVLKSEIETLVAGETVEKEIHEELTYNEIYSSVDNVWSLLYMTGYLTQHESSAGSRLRLCIPNMEIRSIFTGQILSMFKETAAADGERLGAFCSALESGDAAEVERIFTSYLEKTISIRDTFARKPTKENFYHGILLGILGYKDGWTVKSNKESGNGYSDILVRIEDEDTGIIIEVKYAEKGSLETVCRDALAQIDRNGYVDELRQEGCHVILKYGIACSRKVCRVVVDKEHCPSVYLANVDLGEIDLERKVDGRTI
ncbi:hypothetical protein B5F07_01060 [Lachnoclostridium sp. An169]|nr:hypothetical protein B5F07_01060 [Lachnoclostridium sp. An169]HJA66577.1 ATP-binding protein [Candidatus Mediterraneibacter cottocaccae]